MSKRDKDTFDMPIFGSIEADEPVPKNIIPDSSISPKLAYQLIKDELMNEGNARLNLATFCQTYMEDEATKLMSETLEKNAIDKTEYPKTTEIESRCINMIANLWHAQKDEEFIGTSTVGSSEASMLAGMAMKFRWRENAKKNGVDINKKPNLIISSGYQVCWEKFSVYWDIELREVPMTIDYQCLNPEVLLNYIDEYTIGVVGRLGITYTGKYDDIKAIDEVLNDYNKSAKNKVYLHIDAASGGLFTPFVNPKLKWDFRLKNVISINASGHKYGLVYPGIGWVIWRDKKYLPEELIFKVDYLGGEMPTIAINFSRSASHVIGQYYNFLRLGKKGYEEIQKKTSDVAKYISNKLEEIGIFKIYHSGEDLPVVCYGLTKNDERKWSLYDLSDRLRMRGWQIPTYTLPPNLEDVVIQRIVCRADLTYDTSETLINDIIEAINELNNAKILVYGIEENKGVYGFTH